MSNPHHKWDVSGFYNNYEVILAPNRYRKLSDPESPTFVGGTQLFGKEGTTLRERALELMLADWPEKADRAIGMEPTIYLHDIILIWRKQDAKTPIL